MKVMSIVRGFIVKGIIRNRKSGPDSGLSGKEKSNCGNNHPSSTAASGSRTATGFYLSLSRPGGSPRTTSLSPLSSSP
jgi:hypothetical protein